MSTLHELRLTLDEHAETIHDDERFTRAAAVHQRVRAVRRRRRATVAAAAVLAIVASVAATRLGAPDDVQPAENWHGVEVPGEADLAAGTYAIDEIQEVEPGQEVTFPYLDDQEVHRRAVSLVATGLGDGTATLMVNGKPMTRLTGGREVSAALGIWLLSAAVELDGAPAGARVGLALYDGPDTVYPSRWYDDELVAQASEPEESAAEVTVDAALGQVTLSALCWSGDGEFTVTVDGESVVSDGQCSQHHRWEDGSISTLANLGLSGDQVGEHTIRVERSEPGISIGVYLPGAGSEVLGQRVARTREYLGRTWTLEDVIEQDRPGSPVSASITTGTEDRLVDFVNIGGTKATFTSGRDGSCRALSTRNVYDYCNPILLAGDTHEITVTGYVDDFEAAILVYRPE